MQWSRYNIVVDSPKYGYLLYNTMSQALLHINAESLGAWKQLQANPDSYQAFKQWEVLVKNRILVENEEDDLNRYISCVLKTQFDPTEVQATILTTRACNFNCVYCYELERPNIFLSEDVEDSIVGFLFSNLKMRHLHVSWYGGEPLLNFSSIERLSKRFLDSGVDYSASMITNASLLDKEKADKLEILRIKALQITIDGTEEVHNSRRPLLGGGATFSTIIENVKYLLSVNKSVRINIRVNIDKLNASNYHKVVAYLRQEFGGECGKQLNIYPGFVADELSSACFDPENDMSQGAVKADFTLRSLKEHHIQIDGFLPRPHIRGCIAKQYYGYVIGPQGEIYNCWETIGHSEFVIGNVKQGLNEFAYSSTVLGDSYLMDAECRSCQFIALCGGGCPILRKRNRNGENVIYCCPEKTHFMQLVEAKYESLLGE